MKTLPCLVIVIGSIACIQVRLVGPLKGSLVPLACDAVVHEVLVVVKVQCEIGEGSVDDTATGTCAVSAHASHVVPDGGCG